MTYKSKPFGYSPEFCIVEGFCDNCDRKVADFLTSKDALEQLERAVVYCPVCVPRPREIIQP